MKLAGFQRRTQNTTYPPPTCSPDSVLTLIRLYSHTHITYSSGDERVIIYISLPVDASSAVVTLSISAQRPQPRGQSDYRVDSALHFVMPRLRKSKQPADTPAQTPTPPVELVQNLVSQRNPRALAVSSTAIALSIGSTFHGTHDAPSDGAAAAREMDTSWQTAHAAVRMAMEITKESSDLCLPLKAIVGAVSALMKNYDVRVACSRTEYLLILCLFPPPASSR